MVCALVVSLLEEEKRYYILTAAQEFLSTAKAPVGITTTCKQNYCKHLSRNLGRNLGRNLNKTTPGTSHMNGSLAKNRRQRSLQLQAIKN